MATPGKPRQSGIAVPSRTSIPTPGRSRSVSSVHQAPSSPGSDDISRAFADAIKANDPAQHRLPQNSSRSSTSLSPQATTQAGHRSVSGNPPSYASTSSASASSYRPPERVRTPVTTSARPSSRHSDVFGRSVSRSFEVGDNVRIESLGFEGTLRYLGEIEGKLGVWAGVELHRGFAGKGKNDGAVNGKHYFTCSPNCGVFVAIVKLSAPTVGPGAVPRPPSVASSRNGRTTPALSGRVTPAFSSSMSHPSTTLSNGRITPSMGSRYTPMQNGRITPSIGNGRVTPGTTPSALSRVRALSKPASSTAPSLAEKITAGSRASKYMSMTAQQLSSRDRLSGNSSQLNSDKNALSSMISPPSQVARSLSSPTRPSSSPSATPKAGLCNRNANANNSTLPTSKSRPSISTPRVRIPSAIAMPPPATPMSSRSLVGSSNKENDGIVPFADLLSNSRTLEDRIAQIAGNSRSTSRPSSVASVRSPAEDVNNLIEQLQSQLAALESENERLKANVPMLNSDIEELNAVKLDRDNGHMLLVAVEEKLAAAEGSIVEQRERISSLELAKEELGLTVSNNERQLSLLQNRIQEQSLELDKLRRANESQQNLVHQNEELLSIKEAHIVELESNLQRVIAESEDEKKEMTAQIDELRLAGQETIALYEERLSTAETRRYELETLIMSMEAESRLAERESVPSPKLNLGSSAMEIDNETLRDQVLHLQKKILIMEDAIEDAHAASEKEEVAFRERMKKLKEKEEGMRKELGEGRKEVERMLKSEASARARVEEIEEAFRESTVALENARAEIESLRQELTNLDGIIGDDGKGDLTTRVSGFVQRASTDRKRYDEDTKRLQRLLDESRAQEQHALRRLNDHSTVLGGGTVEGSHQELANLNAQNSNLRDQLLTLSTALEERSRELETLRKKANRDVPISAMRDSTSSVATSPSPKHEISASRQEVTGLKHIIQELQKENSSAAHRLKILESDKHLLTAEIQQLRQEVQILEGNLETSLANYETSEGEKHSSENDDASLQRMLRDQKARFETEMDQLRKRLADAEMKHTRVSHDLNKEISELEALVESKIYREDELEQEVERLKDRLSRRKKTSKTIADTLDQQHRLSSASSNTQASDTLSQAVCEICERPGHDIFNCDLLKDETSGTFIGGQRPISGVHADLFCVDCESHGHTADSCPHSLDVF